MGDPGTGPDRGAFSPSAAREWRAAEHSEGVFFAESGTRRVGPFPAEAAHREATRRNEYELVVGAAAAILAAEGGPELRRLARERRYAGALDPALAAALWLLYERGHYEEAAETERGPVVLIERFIALLEPGGVVVREYDTPAGAGVDFEVLREEG